MRHHALIMLTTFALLTSACADDGQGSVGDGGESGEQGDGDGDGDGDGEGDGDGDIEGFDEDGAGVYEAVPRLIAIGDVHGDGISTGAVLQAAGVVDENYNWAAGTTWVVQTGDQLDRGYEEEEILGLFEQLRQQAATAGGRFIALNGNHEVMQTEGRMDYVFDLEAFGGLEARVEAFAPGGPWALTLAKRNILVQVGETVFVHGGVLPEFAAEGVLQINSDAKAWFNGTQPTQPASIDGSGSVIWDRTYSDGDPGPEGCATLDEALALMGAKRMVVAHTVQDNINSACDGKVWRIDTGMAAYYGGGLEALEILDDETVNIISGG